MIKKYLTLKVMCVALLSCLTLALAACGSDEPDDPFARDKQPSGMSEKRGTGNRFADPVTRPRLDSSVLAR